MKALGRLSCALGALAIGAAGPAGAAAGVPVLASLHSFRLHLVDSTPQGNSQRDITYVAPDKLRIEIVGTPTVVVAIGKNVWLRGQNGGWQKAQYGGGVDPLSDVRGTFELGRELQGKGVRYLGVARLGNTRTKVYDVSQAAAGARGVSTRIWIGSDDGYPHRIEQRKGGYVFVATYSAWNQPLSVSAP